MLREYNGIEYVWDPEVSFCMMYSCYMNGANCYTCRDKDCELIDAREYFEENEE